MKINKVVLFSWDFYPSNLVASRRTTSWTQNLKKNLPEKIEIQILTGNSRSVSIEGINSLVILKKGPFKGLPEKIWHIAQLGLIIRNIKEPSLVIMSAGPFYFLLTSAFIPKRHSIVFDLRDPFLSDSKNSLSPMRKFFRKIFQNWFIKQPHAIITINDNLRRDYGIPDQFPHIIIPNGFETREPKACTHNKKIIVLGKVYENLKVFISDAIKIDPSLEFHQYTDLSKTPEANKLPRMERVYIHDEIPSSKIPETCSEYGIGLISSYPEDFVLPVKIFDYVMANQKIIILNDKNSPNTEIKHFLKHYPNVFYSYDGLLNANEFKDFLEMKYHPFDLSLIEPIYFREESTKLLANFLKANF
jgi:hypothetical protein